MKTYQVEFRPRSTGTESHAAYAYSYRTIVAQSKATAKKSIKAEFPWAIITAVVEKREERRVA